MLKQILASVASAAALATSPAMAAPKAPAPLTPLEQATVKKLNDFAACAKPAMDALQAKIMGAVEPIMKARAQAATAETIKAAKAAGLTQDQAEQVAEAMIMQDAQTLVTLLASGEEDPRVGCGKKLGIGTDNGFTEEFMKAVMDLRTKYPQGIPGIKVPPALQPKTN